MQSTKPFASAPLELDFAFAKICCVILTFHSLIMYIRWAESHSTVEPRSLDGSTRSPEIRAILITFSILSTTVVALRTYIRHMVLHSFGWDDGVMVIAQVFALGAAAAIGLGWFYQALSESWRLLTLA